MGRCYTGIDNFWTQAGGSHGGSEYKRFVCEKKEYKCEPEQGRRQPHKRKTEKT